MEIIECDTFENDSRKKPHYMITFTWFWKHFIFLGYG